MQRPFMWMAAIGALASLAGPPCASADEAPSTNRSHRAAGSGMVVYRDPVTGKLGLPPKETTPSARAATPAPLVTTSTPAGGRRVDLQGRFAFPMVATVLPDGKVKVGCDTGHPDGTE
jgi:hypothetical protein